MLISRTDLDQELSCAAFEAVAAVLSYYALPLGHSVVDLECELFHRLYNP